MLNGSWGFEEALGCGPRHIDFERFVVLLNWWAALEGTAGSLGALTGGVAALLQSFGLRVLHILMSYVKFAQTLSLGRAIWAIDTGVVLILRLELVGLSI